MGEWINWSFVFLCYKQKCPVSLRHNWWNKRLIYIVSFIPFSFFFYFFLFTFFFFFSFLFFSFLCLSHFRNWNCILKHCLLKYSVKLVLKSTVTRNWIQSNINRSNYITPTIKISWGEIDKVDKENLTFIEKQNCLVESYKLPSPNFVVPTYRYLH